MYEHLNKLSTTTNVVPVLIERNVVTEHTSSHDIVHLGKLNLSRTLQEVSVSLNQLHSLHVLSSGDDALIDSLHLLTNVRKEYQRNLSWNLPLLFLPPQFVPFHKISNIHTFG